MDFMALTMIDPAPSWFKIVGLPLVHQLKTTAIKVKESSIVKEIFNKSSNCIVQFVNKIWLSRYPKCWYLIYDNGSEFKLNFEYPSESCGFKHKPNTIKNPQANVILEHVHQILAQILCMAELNMAESVTPNDVNVFLHNAYLTVLKASQGTARSGCNMLF